jgi:hypothetical protein
VWISKRKLNPKRERQFSVITQFENQSAAGAVAFPTRIDSPEPKQPKKMVENFLFAASIGVHTPRVYCSTRDSTRLISADLMRVGVILVPFRRYMHPKYSIFFDLPNFREIPKTEIRSTMLETLGKNYISDSYPQNGLYPPFNSTPSSAQRCEVWHHRNQVGIKEEDGCQSEPENLLRSHGHSIIQVRYHIIAPWPRVISSGTKLCARHAHALVSTRFFRQIRRRTTGVS